MKERWLWGLFVAAAACAVAALVGVVLNRGPSYPRVPEVRTSPEYSRLVGQVVGLLEGAAGTSEED